MKKEIISSVENKLVKEAKSLQDKKFRKNLGKFLIDGKKLVGEAVKGMAKVDKIFVDHTRAHEFDDILQNFDGNVVLVTPKVLGVISENATPQGIIAEVFAKNQNEIDKNYPILILDRIQDPGNLGTMVRTAVASGFLNIVLVDSVDAFSPKVVRASSGGVLTANIIKMTEEEIISYSKNSGTVMLVADMGGENIYKMQKPTKNFALVIGNEGQGVSDNFAAAGKIVSLPMRPEMESLNAGVCASIMMYQIVGEKI